MLPPRDVYSVVITNRASAQLKVEVTYTSVDSTTTVRVLNIPAGETKTAKQHTVTKGSATFTDVITSVKATTQDGPQLVGLLNAPFPNISGPTSEYAIVVSDVGLSTLVVSPLV